MRSIVEDEGIDLIIISAPERHGLELAGAALQAGKHVRIM
jgi:predicted dehydrogenase